MELKFPANELSIQRQPRDGNLYGNGTVGDWFEVNEDGVVNLTIVAAGQKAMEPGLPEFDSWPRAIVRIIGHKNGRIQELLFQAITINVANETEFNFQAHSPPGTIGVQIDFINELFVDENNQRILYLTEFRLENVTGKTSTPIWWYPFGPNNERFQTVTDAAISKHRKGSISVFAGPDRPVKVTQLEHEFQFGCVLSQTMFSGDESNHEEIDRYQETFQKNFNLSVHGNALKWPVVERQPGQSDYSAADRMLKWSSEFGIPMRGHNIFWAVNDVDDDTIPDWVELLDGDQLRTAVQKRVVEVVEKFRGQIGEYDVNNEMLHGHFYRQKLQDDTISHDMFRKAHETDMEAVLYLNEYDILAGGTRATAYRQLISEFVTKQLPLGGIGCQSHFGYKENGQAFFVEPNRIQRTLDDLAEFGLPIKITEFDFEAKDGSRESELEKAQQLETFFRLSFAHPAVEGIVLWGFGEATHWLPKAALWNSDWSPTPAGKVYRRLVFDEWWTNWEGRTGQNGQAKIRAFFGTYRVECNGQTQVVDLSRSTPDLIVRL